MSGENPCNNERNIPACLVEAIQRVLTFFVVAGSLEETEPVRSKYLPRQEYIMIG